MINLDPKDVITIKTYLESHDYVQAGARIIALTELGWTRIEIANSLGYSAPTLRKWANAAKQSGVHAIFNDLSTKEQVLSRVTNYSNHTLQRTSRAFSPDQTSFLTELHTSTKRTRSWTHFKELINYLLYLRYPVSHIAQALDTSNSHIKTFQSTHIPGEALKYSQEFHSRRSLPSAKTTPETKKYLVITATPSTSYLSSTKLLPTKQTLFTLAELSDLIPIVHATPFIPPNFNTQSVIIEESSPYLISQEDAFTVLGITNEKEL